MLGCGADGRWAASDVGLCVGRQNGKNEILVVRELFGLLILGERGILHTAHLHKAVSTQYRRLKGVFDSTPELKARVSASNSSVGQQFIELKTGQRIEFATRQGSKTGRSLTLDLVAHDECMYISDASIGAVMPTLSARSMEGTIQTIYAGSAPDADEADHDGVPFSRLRTDALSGAEDVFWAEWSVECEDREKVPDEWLIDPEKFAESNPAFGKRIALEWCLKEARQLSRQDFLRERLGITVWPDPSEDAGRVISRDTWDSIACRDESQRIVGAKTFGLDANVDNTRSSIGVAGERPDDLTHIAVVAHGRSTGWLLDKCKDLEDNNPGAQFAVDVRGPLAHMIKELRDADLSLIELDAADYGDACAGFLRDVNQGLVRYPFPQPELSDAVQDARQQNLGDRWKWSRRNSTSADISPLVAVTIAWWGSHHRDSEYATVLFGSDYAPAAVKQPEVGTPIPKVITQDKVTTCFACSQGSCPRHDT